MRVELRTSRSSSDSDLGDTSSSIVFLANSSCWKIWLKARHPSIAALRSKGWNRYFGLKRAGSLGSEEESVTSPRDWVLWMKRPTTGTSDVMGMPRDGLSGAC